jgi:type IV secretion system protein VirB4
LTTQQPDDVLDHELAKTAVQQSVTGIYLPNPNAIKKDYVEGFKVTPQEFDIIRSLPAASRAFLVKQDGKSAVVRFDLGGLDDVITILSGSQDNIELLDEIRRSVGDAPEAWVPLLIEKVNERRDARRTERAST